MNNVNRKMNINNTNCEREYGQILNLGSKYLVPSVKY